jgi:hypothetical protein
MEAQKLMEFATNTIFNILKTFTNNKIQKLLKIIIKSVLQTQILLKLMRSKHSSRIYNLLKPINLSKFNLHKRRLTQQSGLLRELKLNKKN